MRIKKICKECGEEFLGSTKKKSTNFCSKICGRRFSHRFVNLEQLRHTMRTKVERGEFISWNKGKKTAQRNSYNCSQCGKEFFQTDAESNVNKICVCGKECRNILLPKVCSANLKSQYALGKKVYGGTTKWYKYNDIKVQGTYELRACKLFDAMIDMKKIASWKYSPQRVKYVGVDGKEHNYIIDFRVNRNDGTFYFVETKGFKRENDDLKWKAVRDMGHQLEVWFNKDIEEKEKIFIK